MHGISKTNGAQAIEPLSECPAKLCSVGFRESLLRCPVVKIHRGMACV